MEILAVLTALFFNLLCLVAPVIIVGIAIYFLLKKQRIRAHRRVLGRIYGYIMQYTTGLGIVVGLIVTLLATGATIPEFSRGFFLPGTVSNETEDKIVAECIDEYGCAEYEVYRYGPDECGECYANKTRKEFGEVSTETVQRNLIVGISILSVAIPFFIVHYIMVGIFERELDKEATRTRRIYLATGLIVYGFLAVIVLGLTVGAVLAYLLLGDKQLLGLPPGLWIVSTLVLVPAWLAYFIPFLECMKRERMPAEDIQSSLPVGAESLRSSIESFGLEEERVI